MQVHANFEENWGKIKRHTGMRRRVGWGDALKIANSHMYTGKTKVIIHECIYSVFSGTDKRASIHAATRASRW